MCWGRPVSAPAPQVAEPELFAEGHPVASDTDLSSYEADPMAADRLVGGVFYAVLRVGRAPELGPEVGGRWGRPRSKLTKWSSS